MHLHWNSTTLGSLRESVSPVVAVPYISKTKNTPNLKIRGGFHAPTSRKDVVFVGRMRGGGGLHSISEKGRKVFLSGDGSGCCEAAVWHTGSPGTRPREAYQTRTKSTTQRANDQREGGAITGGDAQIGAGNYSSNRTLKASNKGLCNVNQHQWACVTGVTASICVNLRQSSASILRLAASVPALAASIPVSVTVSPRQSSTVTQRQCDNSAPVQQFPLLSLSPRSKSFGVVDDDEHGKSWFKNQKKIVKKAASAQHTGSQVVNLKEGMHRSCVNTHAPVCVNTQPPTFLYGRILRNPTEAMVPLLVLGTAKNVTESWMSGNDSFPPVDGPTFLKLHSLLTEDCFPILNTAFLASLKFPNSLQHITTKLKAAGLWFKLPSRLNPEVQVNPAMAASKSRSEIELELSSEFAAPSAPVTLCLSGFGLWAFLCWLFRLIPRRRNRGLVPYFNSQLEGSFLGIFEMVQLKITLEVRPILFHLRCRDQSETKYPIYCSRLLTPASRCLADRSSASPANTIATPTTWDGWPDGRFQCSFSLQDVMDTNQLEMNWICEALKGRQGSLTTRTSKKGKEIRPKYWYAGVYFPGVLRQHAHRSCCAWYRLSQTASHTMFVRQEIAIARVRRRVCRVLVP
ncbi:hypothetical protein B0H13DRAFT_1897699 [Mycena leptocephala]|nr:hypothetical protein B0H13DRAFT_1897699 [Mycena leptocephala]